MFWLDNPALIRYFYINMYIFLGNFLRYLDALHTKLFDKTSICYAYKSAIQSLACHIQHRQIKSVHASEIELRLA